MHAEHLIPLLSLALVALFAAQAWRNGVVGMLWGVAGALGGLAGGALAYSLAIGRLPVGLGLKLGLAFAAGLVVYLLVRAAAKSLLMSLFEPEGPLRFLADGFGGALVSLVPSLLTLTILALGIRIGGTLSELRRMELLVTPGREFPVNRYPARPLAATWRDGLDALPAARAFLDGIEPLGRKPESALAGLLIASKKGPLKRHLAENPESRPVFEAPAFQALAENPAIQELNAAGDRLALLQHPELRQAANDPDLRPKLEDLEWVRLVDAFLLSPEWQQLLEGYERSREDTAGTGD